MSDTIWYISPFMTKQVSKDTARKIMELIFQDRVDELERVKFIQLYNDNVVRVSFESENPYWDRNSKNAFRYHASISEICKMEYMVEND